MESSGGEGIEPRHRQNSKPRFFNWLSNPSGLFKNTREDARIFERVPAHLSLRYHNLYSKKWGLVQTHDISAKGIGLMSDSIIPLNSPLEIWLPIPDKGESLYTTGKAVWSKSMWFNKYRVGIYLEKPDMVSLLPVFRQRL